MPFRLNQGMTVVACLFLALFLGVADNQVLSPLLPSMRRQLARSSAEMGFLFTGYSLSAGISVLIWGPLSDVFGRKMGLLSGLLIFAAGSSACFLSNTYGALLSGRVLTGMGASMLSLNTISYAADFFPYEKRGWAMGSILASYFAALILGVPIGSWIGDQLGWHAVFAMGAASAILLWAATRSFLPKLAAGRRNTKAELIFIQQFDTYVGFFNRRKTIGALLSSFCASAGTMGFLAFLGVWLHDAFGISGKKVGLVFLASGAAALLASPLAGALSDRIGKKVQFVVSNLALAALLLVLPRLAWGAPLFGVFGCVSLAAAFRQGPLEALVSEVIPTELRGSFIALKNSFSQLGIALAAMASGLLFQNGGYSGVCLLGALFNLLAAAGVMWMIKDHRL